VLMRRFCLLFLILISSLAVAEKYALLVGINDYQGDISPLRYCVADVEAFSQALVEVGGFAEDNVYLMTSQMSGRKEPTHVNVIRQLSLLSERVKPEDTFIFYFSGHGITKAGQSFLLTTNSDTTTKDTLTITAVDLNQAKDILSRIQAQQLLTVIDACRNDPDSGRGEQDNLLTDDFSRGFKIKRDQGNAGTPGVSATLYACAVGERAYEWPEKQHGVFSYYLLEGLNGKAANSNGEVVVTDLADYTQRKVVQWAQEVRGKKQTPWLDQSGGAKLVLVDNQLGLIEQQLSRLQQEQALIQQQLEQAQQSDSAINQAEVKQRLAEQQERVRQAKAKAEEERLRQQARLAEQEEQAKQQEQDLLRQTEAREEVRRKKVEIERQKQRLEAERRKLKAEQRDSMGVDQVLAKARELQAKIDQVQPQVEAEIDNLITAIPKPKPTKVGARGEFETREMYQKRQQEANQDDQLAQRQYQREVSQVKATLQGEVETRRQGFQQALSTLNWDLILDETQVVLNLGRYDPDNQLFPQAELSVKDAVEVQSFPWSLPVPLAQAQQFKSSVIDGTVKIRADIKLDANSQKARIESATIEDFVQELRYETPIMIEIRSRPSGATVWIDQEKVGETPFRDEIEAGIHQVEVGFPRSADEYFDQKKVEAKKGSYLNLYFDFGRDKLPPIIGKDGAEMVLIPSGPSTLPFHMDKFEVTNAQYRKFVQATGHHEPGCWNNNDYNQSNQPVMVSWNDAAAYAKWAGKRLPTEAEWEYAARGGLVGKTYSWGDDESLARDYANYYGTGGRDRWEWVASPVGSFKPNGYDLYDIAGNVQEWCEDWYESDKSGRVLRGGRWDTGRDSVNVVSRTYDRPTSATEGNGFRCVQD